ncbi:phage portal protein, HK97 family [Sphingomonas guangdongensis]|uniref:Phage portal protein, HK97 family n=1 Tax=Sphingomonas guangdongensis TaxID=1141890 RepID=A0A285QXR7_9SPHN|nr:phage portal protein [Sphingomonas guangdongensis]SOB86760.1 phage portal protein, HK97 family [Sphingomonas guangdongensis]
MGKLSDWFFGPLETKSETITPHSEAYVEDRMLSMDAGGFTSVAYACAQIISQGLALPPAYVQRVTGTGREFATKHPLYNLLNAKPNRTQCSYEFREVMGWQAALHGNAYAWINRARNGEVLELVPLDHSEVSRIDPVELGAAPTFNVGGRTYDTRNIWHFKGPSAHRRGGLVTSAEARRAITLMSVAESFGTDLFANRAALEGIMSIDGAASKEQLDQLRTQMRERHTGAGKRGRTAFIPAPVKYQALSATATDSQWLETRRYQIEEICRYFRVSPTKVFHTLGSQSYSSVEQAHIAHDQDTDAHWHARFAQSATNNLLSDSDRAAGYSVVIDNRDYLRGTANERADYYNKGLTGGWLTQNEAREAEGYALSNDPDANRLRPAANLFGSVAPANKKTPEPK